MKAERVILSSFLFANYYVCEKEKPMYFKLDVSFFSTPLMVRIAQKINDTLDAGEPMEVLAIYLESKLKGTRFEQEWLEIFGASPLSIDHAKKLYDQLTKEKLCAMI